jgi:glycosyltransferase involved in cell wall biosynthesis
VADPGAEAPCPVQLLPGLEARTSVPVDLEEVLARARPDVVHLHNVVNPWVLAWGAEHGAVLSVQDHRTFCPGRGKWTASGEVCRESMSPSLCESCFDDAAYHREIQAITEARLAAARRMRVSVLSRYMRDELVAAGVPGTQVHVVPPFVHGLGFAGASREPCALFAGRLVAAKGVRDAIAAWRLSGVDLPLVIAGTGPLRSEIEAEHGVHCLGWVSRGELGALYRSARVVVFPPRWQEPFGLVGLEALTLGTPVAAWRSGGVSEWHPGPGLVPWGDVAALARALRDLPGQRPDSPSGFSRERTRGALRELYGA